MIRLLLIRHAPTEASDNNVLLGSTDAGATREGLARLARLRSLLKDKSPDIWYCSPMLRTVQTIEKLQDLEAVDHHYEVDTDLREIDLGRWEQKSFNEIKEDDPDLIADWSSHFEDFVFPGGESVAGFTKRVAQILDRCRSSGKKEIGLVTHGGVIRIMICLALGLNVKNYLLFHVSPASLTVLELHSDGGVLVGLNQ